MATHVNVAAMLQKAAEKHGCGKAPDQNSEEDAKAELHPLCRALLEEFFEKMPTAVGKSASKKERDERGLKMSSLVYGEVSFDSLGIAFEKIRSKYAKADDPIDLRSPGGVFYDLGSGSGKPVIAAALLHPFRRCVGIELLEGLHVLAHENRAWFESEEVRARMAEYETRAPPSQIELVHGSIIAPEEHDWSDGDVVFANSTCFDDELIGKIAEQAERLKKGAFVITLTRKLPSEQFAVLESQMYNMSWGGATVYIQQKITARSESRPEKVGETDEAGERVAPSS